MKEILLTDSRARVARKMFFIVFSWNTRKIYIKLCENLTKCITLQIQNLTIFLRNNVSSLLSEEFKITLYSKHETFCVEKKLRKTSKILSSVKCQYKRDLDEKLQENTYLYPNNIPLLYSYLCVRMKYRFQMWIGIKNFSRKYYMCLKVYC